MKFRILFAQDTAIDQFAITSSDIVALASVFEAYLGRNCTLPSDVEASHLVLSVVSEKEIAKINKRFRHISRPTDVLSFPLWEEPSWNDAKELFGDLPLGDIFICPEQVAKFAAENSTTELQETVLDLCHGFLHLLGYDHINDEQKEKMWHEQDKLLTEFFEKNEK